jgi:Uma2 family endonuclease
MSLYAAVVASRLDQRLGPFVDERRLGIVVTEALFIVDPKRNLRRRPDVAFVSAERWPLDRLIPETGDWEVIPDLAVEVVSPSDTWEEVLAKIDEYFEKGVRQVWIAAPVAQKVYLLDSPTRVHILTTHFTSGQFLTPDSWFLTPGSRLLEGPAGRIVPPAGVGGGRAEPRAWATGAATRCQPA